MTEKAQKQSTGSKELAPELIYIAEHCRKVVPDVTEIAYVIDSKIYRYAIPNPCVLLPGKPYSLSEIEAETQRGKLIKE